MDKPTLHRPEDGELVSLTDADISIERDVSASKRTPVPSVSLNGKGVIEGSNNYAKMNFQNN